MASNTATLELQVQTESVKRASTRLDRLSRAGRDTTKAARTLESRTRKLAQQQSDLAKTVKRAEVGQDKMTNGTLKMSRAVNAAGSALLRSGKQLDRYSAKAGRAAASSRRAKGSIHQLNNTLGSMRGIIAGIGLGMLARHIVEMGTSFDRIRNVMHSVFGSVEAANAAFEDMRGIANYLGADIFALADMYAQMSAASAGTQLAGEATRDIFLSVAEASTVLRFNLEQTRGVIKAFEQMISKGTVQAEELRNQLGDRLPGAFNLFVRAYFGVETATESLRREFNTLMRTGQLVSAEVLPRVAEELRRTFGPGLEASRRSAQAEMNRMVTAFRLLALSGWEAGFERTVINVSNTLRSLFESENLIQIVRGTAAMFEAVTGTIYRFRAVIVPALAALTSFASVFIAGRLLAAMASFVLTASGSGGIVGIIAVLAAVATAAATAFGFLGDNVNSSSSSVEDAAELSTDYLDVSIDLSKALDDQKDRTNQLKDSIDILKYSTREAVETQSDYRTVAEQMNWQTMTLAVLGLAAAFNGVAIAANRALASSQAVAAIGAVRAFGGRALGAVRGAGAGAARAGTMAYTASGFAAGFSATMSLFDRNSRRFGARMTSSARRTGVLSKAMRGLLSVVGLNSRAFARIMRSGSRIGGLFGFMTRAAAGLAGVLSTVLRSMGMLLRFVGGPVGLVLGGIGTFAVSSFMENRRRAAVTREFEELQAIMAETNEASLLPANAEQLTEVAEERTEVMDALNEHIRTAQARIDLSQRLIEELNQARARAENPSLFNQDRYGEDAAEWMNSDAVMEGIRENALQGINDRIADQNQHLQDAQAIMEQLGETAANTTEHFDQVEEDLRNFAAFDRDVMNSLNSDAESIQFRVDTIGMDSFEADMHRYRLMMNPVEGAEGALIPRSPEDLELLQSIIDNLGILRVEAGRVSAENTVFGLQVGAMTQMAGEIATIERAAAATTEELLEMAGALGMSEEEIRALVSADTARKIEALNDQFRQLTDMLTRAQSQTDRSRSRVGSIGETRYEGVIRQHREERERITAMIAEANTEAERQIGAGRDETLVTEELTAVLAQYGTQLDLNNQYRERTIAQMQTEGETVAQVTARYALEAEQALATGEALKQLERQRLINERLSEARSAAEEQHELGNRSNPYLTPGERDAIIAGADLQLRNERTAQQAEDSLEVMREAAEEMEKLWEGVADSISTTIMGAFDFTRPRQSINEFLLDIIRAVNDAILEVLRMQVILPIVKSAMRALPFMPFAQGGVFDGPVRAFARGGVMNEPTMFGYGGGRMGLMGEAGPEAILPLARGRDGALGVQMHGQATGGGLSSLVINNETHVHVEGDADAEEIARKTSGQTREALKGLVAETVMEMSNSPGMGGKVTKL